MNPLLILVVLFLATTTSIFAEFHIVSIPDWAKLLQCSPNLVQHTITAYMLAAAVSGLIFGPISDRYGRKKPLLVGCIIGTSASFLLAITSDISYALVLRFIQGFGISAGTTIMRGWMRDLYSGDKLRKISAWFAMLGPFLISFSPALGSFIYDYHPSVFFLFMLNGSFLLLLTITSAIILPEPNTPEQRANTAFLEGFWVVIKNPLFRNNVLIFSLCIFCILIYVTASPLLIITTMNYSSQDFGIIQSILGGAWLIGSLINFHLIKRLSTYDCIHVGGWLCFTGFLTMLITYQLPIPKIISLVAPMVLVYISITLCCSNAFVNMITPFKNLGATAGALMTLGQFSAAALGASCIALLPEHTHLPLALLGCASSGLLLIIAIHQRLTHK